MNIANTERITQCGTKRNYFAFFCDFGRGKLSQNMTLKVTKYTIILVINFE